MNRREFIQQVFAVTGFAGLSRFGLAYDAYAGVLQQRQVAVIRARNTGGAGTTNDAYDARIRFGPDTLTGSAFKICLLADDGSLLATSNSGTFAASTTVTVTFPTPYTMIPTTSYRVGIIGNGYLSLGISGGSWEMMTDATNSYTTPVGVIPGSDSNSAQGTIAIEIRNSLGAVLIGSVGGTETAISPSGADQMFYWSTSEVY